MAPTDRQRSHGQGGISRQEVNPYESPQGIDAQPHAFEPALIWLADLALDFAMVPPVVCILVVTAPISFPLILWGTPRNELPATIAAAAASIVLWSFWFYSLVVEPLL